MTLYPSLPSRNPSYPSGRYLKTDPLRREFGLKLLTETLPEPLRTSLIRAWRHPGRYDGKQAIQSLYRQRPDDAQLFSMPPRLLGVITLTELEVARRVVETPRTSISRDLRNKLLKAQGVVSARPLRRAGHASGRSRRPGRVPAPANRCRLGERQHPMCPDRLKRLPILAAS